ncbi:MAG: helix-turn-helix domain-containing protein [Gammaproteobacteria bacterium]|nr:helix-turn-helix domain-containing protein [Gammaproteobacteria bacterium]MBU1602539.1 helix-turn-helix domain-containing protein [Gammaproteobacteria bacterium]MBU2433344.1 helix-turn-helix domain-containing protein [Gammaproteobacteria bacterium]MBU2451260.1 helix-turn-helix domain-containing protein [Gammaproteobacteria bacterium]
MDLEMSKTQDALRLMREKGLTPYAAAKEVGITPTTLYAAIKREEAKGVITNCPCCGTLVPGEKINRDVLK